MKAVTVRIDDGLPFIEKPGCSFYMAGQPSRGENGRLIAFIPLLEKAWANFLDAVEPYPRDMRGYAGMTGTPAEQALQALMGGNARAFERKQVGFSLTFASLLVQCINIRRACVLGAPHFGDYRLGVLPTGPVPPFPNPVGTIRRNDDGSHRVTEPDSGRTLHLVGPHYYGMQATQFLDGQLITFDNAEVDIHNPWCLGTGPLGDGACSVRGRQRILLKNVPHLFTGVAWTDPVSF